MKQIITMHSRVKDVWNTIIGHDILAKLLLQTGLSEKALLNSLVGNFSLWMIRKMTEKILDAPFWPAFLHLVNSELDDEAPLDGKVERTWWKEAVFYQIYPRTFCDSNGDGIGDIQGIIQKLDYLKELGVDALWLSPIYDSPMADNGYDIRDYEKINSDFGTMEDFEQLLKEVHAKGMKLIMDLVVNHTSDEHRWFQQAIQDPKSPYRDYYFIRPYTKEELNNWTSFFSGSAWSHYGKEKDWALHLFAEKQVDLNWDNPKVREEIADMVNRWLDKGVDGFRMDVINYISKDKGLPAGNESVGTLMGYRGIEHYYYGPHLHTYLHELHQNTFAKHHAFSIGETPGLGRKMCRRVTGAEREELDMVFSFDHLETPGHVRWDAYQYDLNYYRNYLLDWQKNYGNNCWMSLFYNNHDNPRMVSKIDLAGIYRKEIEILLAVLQFTMKGTPFIYQGDEMGLVNYLFRSIDDIQDIESKNYYEKLILEGEKEIDAWKTILAGTRDHARRMLPWNNQEIPELKQEIDTSIQSIYKQLIHLRKEHSCLIYGELNVIDCHFDRFVYERKDAKESFRIDCNLGNQNRKAYKMPHEYALLGESSSCSKELRPYEVRIWYYKKERTAKKN